MCDLAVAAAVFFVAATLYGTLLLGTKEGAGTDDLLESMMVALVFSPVIWILLLFPVGLLAAWRQLFGKSYFTIPFGIGIGSLFSVYWASGVTHIDWNDSFALKWLLLGPVCGGATGAFVSYCRERDPWACFSGIFHSMVVAIVAALVSSLVCEIGIALLPQAAPAYWSYGYLLFVAAWIALFVWMLILFPISLFLKRGASLWSYRFSIPIGFIAGGLFSIGMARYAPDFELLRPWFHFQVLHFPLLGGITGAVCAGAFSWLELKPVTPFCAGAVPASAETL